MPRPGLLHQEQQAGKPQARHRSSVQNSAFVPIQSAIATIITFSVSDTKPSGTFELPPTQAHFSSRLSI